MELMRWALWRWEGGSGHSQKDLVITCGFSSGAEDPICYSLTQPLPVHSPIPTSQAARAPASPSAQYGALSLWLSLLPQLTHVSEFTHRPQA